MEHCKNKESANLLQGVDTEVLASMYAMIADDAHNNWKLIPAHISSNEIDNWVRT